MTHNGVEQAAATGKPSCHSQMGTLVVAVAMAMLVAVEGVQRRWSNYGIGTRSRCEHSGLVSAQNMPTPRHLFSYNHVVPFLFCLLSTSSYFFLLLTQRYATTISNLSHEMSTLLCTSSFLSRNLAPPLWSERVVMVAGRFSDRLSSPKLRRICKGGGSRLT